MTFCRSRIFILMLFCVSSFEAVAQSSAKDYETRIEQTSRTIARQVREGLRDENVIQVLTSNTGNAIRRIYNSIPLAPKWKTPFGEIRRDFYQATQLLYEVASDDQLSQPARAKLIGDLTQSIGQSLDQFTDDYADPIDARLLDTWRSGKTRSEKWGQWILSRLLFIPLSISRDVYESLWMFDAKKDPTTGKISKFHAPDALPILGEDWRRNRISSGVLKDTRLVFSEALKNPSKHPNEADALVHLRSSLSDAEPIRYAACNYLTLFMYRAAQIYLLLNPPFQMASEPTVLGGMLTGVFGFALPLEMLRQLHKSNSGYSMAMAERRLAQTGIIAPIRWIKNLYEPFWTGLKIAIGKNCASTVSQLPKRRPQ